jgi:hypothetical protein
MIGRQRPTRSSVASQADERVTVAAFVDWITQREVIARIKKAERQRDDVHAQLAALEELRGEMRRAKARTVGDLPESCREKYRDVLRFRLRGDA